LVVWCLLNWLIPQQGGGGGRCSSQVLSSAYKDWSCLQHPGLPGAFSGPLNKSLKYMTYGNFRF